MARRHGIGQDTYERFVIDAGEVRKNFVSVAEPGTLLGATRGGSTFTVETEYKDMAVDGAKGPVVGGRRIIKVTCRINANFVEWTPDLVLAAVPGAALTLDSTHAIMSRSLQITDANYLTGLALIGEVSGSSNPVIFYLPKALADGNFEAALTDGEETVLAVQFTGHFEVADLNTEPWKVYIPKNIGGYTGAYTGMYA